MPVLVVVTNELSPLASSVYTFISRLGPVLHVWIMFTLSLGLSAGMHWFISNLPSHNEVEAAKAAAEADANAADPKKEK